MDFIFAVILFAVIGVGIAFFAARNQSRCPKCGNMPCKEPEADLYHVSMG